MGDKLEACLKIKTLYFYVHDGIKILSQNEFGISNSRTSLKIMIDESKQIKEVFARFGLAIYWAQVLEHQIVNMFIAAKLHEKQRITRGDIDIIFDERFNQTMGKLIKELKDTYKVSPQMVRQLEDSLKTRNMLAHRYFRERVTVFATIEGRSEMIRELDKAIKDFESVDKILTDISMKIAEKYGVTQEMIDKLTEEILSGKDII